MRAIFDEVLQFNHHSIFKQLRHIIIKYNAFYLQKLAFNIA